MADTRDSQAPSRCELVGVGDAAAATARSGPPGGPRGHNAQSLGLGRDPGAAPGDDPAQRRYYGLITVEVAPSSVRPVAPPTRRAGRAGAGSLAGTRHRFDLTGAAARAGTSGHSPTLRVSPAPAGRSHSTRARSRTTQPRRGHAGKGPPTPRWPTPVSPEPQARSAPNRYRRSCPGQLGWTSSDHDREREWEPWIPHPSSRRRSRSPVGRCSTRFCTQFRRSLERDTQRPADLSPRRPGCAQVDSTPAAQVSSSRSVPSSRRRPLIGRPDQDHRRPEVGVLRGIQQRRRGGGLHNRPAVHDCRSNHSKP